MPTTTGKNERYIEISALGTRPVSPTAPRPTTTMGATARMGMVWLAMIQGISERSDASLWMMATASPTPRTVPKAKPSSVADRVIQP
ncbi:hypothetical protein D3C87_1907200 [compost metagenome]